MAQPDGVPQEAWIRLGAVQEIVRTPKWEIFHAHLAGAIQRRLGADDVGQWQIVSIGGNVVDALFAKGDADD